jgi:putative flippase GtrA
MERSRSRLPREVFGFLLVGSVGFLIDLFVFNASVFSGISPSTANLIAITSAGLFGFIGNSFYSFRHRFDQGSRSSMTVKYFIFSLLSLIASAALTSIVLAGLSGYGLIEQNLGRTTVIVGLVVVRFLGLKFLVYRDPKSL